MLILFIKAAHKLVFYIISTLLCKMAQLCNESVLEISLDEDINTRSVPNLGPSKGDPLNAPLQVASLPEEPMETEILSDLIPESELSQNLCK